MTHEEQAVQGAAWINKKKKSEQNKTLDLTVQFNKRNMKLLKYKALLKCMKHKGEFSLEITAKRQVTEGAEHGINALCTPSFAAAQPQSPACGFLAPAAPTAQAGCTVSSSLWTSLYSSWF